MLQRSYYEINLQQSRVAGKYHLLLVGQQVSAGLWAAPSRLCFLTCAAHDMPVCIFLRVVMYGTTYGPPIIGFIFPETSAAQLMYFFVENAEVCSIFLCKNRNTRSNLCFPSNYIIYIYIILYVIMYYFYYHHIFNRYLHI